MESAEVTGVFGLILAQVIPLALGFAWLNLLWREGHLAVKIGYGYLIGIGATTLVLYVWGKMGLPLVFMPIASFLLAMAVIPLLGVSGRNKRYQKTAASGFDYSWQTVLWVFLLALILQRFSNLLLEEIWRPLYPWDAWMNWAPKAKVWFESRDLASFVHPDQWRVDSLSQGTYTLGNPKASTYPILVPLIQFWSALGMGEWRDNWINIPWMTCAVALGFAFYGQLRMLRTPPLFSMLSVYLLLSMPYLNTHVALAGYAEIWLATFYCAALMALVNWSFTKSIVQLGLVILLGVACSFTKLPGIVWAMTLIVGLVLGCLSPKTQKIMLLTALISITLLFFSQGLHINLPGGKQLILSSAQIEIPGLGRYHIELHHAGQYFILNDLLRDNWHLLGWVFLLLILPLAHKTRRIPEFIPGLIVIGTGLLFIIGVFFFTDHFIAAKDSTTINRAVFHFLPALAFLVFLMLSMRRIDGQEN